MKAEAVSIGARVVYAPGGPRRNRAGIVTGLVYGGRGARASLLLDDKTEVVCPLNLVQPMPESKGRSCVRCSVCRRVCGEEWHSDYQKAAKEASVSGWLEYDAGRWSCPECDRGLR